MNAQPSHPVVLLREVEPGEWSMQMPRITMDVDDRLEEGVDCLETGDLRQATTIFRRLIKDYPEHLDAYHHLAMGLQESGKHKEAAKIWRSAVELALKFFPERFDIDRHRLPWMDIDNRPFLRAYHGHGLCLLESGAIESALKIFERLVGLNPDDNLGVRALVVGCCFALKQPEKVLEVCLKYPDDTMQELVYGKPLALFQQSQIEQATAALKHAIRSQPSTARQWAGEEYCVTATMKGSQAMLREREEAVPTFMAQRFYWGKTPGALEWLKGQLKKVKPKY